MEKKTLQKMTEIRQAEKEKKFSKAVKLYKGLTLVYPEKSQYWYLLGISLFKMGKNKDAFLALSTAKKLGSHKALELIVSIIDGYSASDAQKAKKVKELLLGKEVSHV